MSKVKFDQNANITGACQNEERLRGLHGSQRCCSARKSAEKISERMLPGLDSLSLAEWLGRLGLYSLQHWGMWSDLIEDHKFMRGKDREDAQHF